MMENAARASDAARLLLALIEGPIALGVAFATFVAFSKAGCQWTRCYDVSGLPWYLGGAVLGLVVGVVYWRRVIRLGDRFRRRLLIDAVAIIVGVAGVVLPQVGGWRAEWQAAHPQARVAPRPPDATPPVPAPPNIAR